MGKQQGLSHQLGEDQVPLPEPYLFFMNFANKDKFICVNVLKFLDWPLKMGLLCGYVLACMSIYIYCVHLVVQGVQSRELESMELTAIWELGREPRSFVRASSALTCWPPPPICLCYFATAMNECHDQGNLYKRVYLELTALRVNPNPGADHGSRQASMVL